VVFQWGAPSILVSAAFTIGNEELAIFANNNNPITSLSVSLIKAIYNGQLHTWGDVFEQCPNCFTSSPIDAFRTQPITLLSFSSLEEPQSIFSNTFMSGMTNITSPGILVPDSTSMIAEIEKDPAAIGFGGSHFLTDQVKRVVVTNGEPPADLVSPILAVMQNEPSSTISSWLACIQKILTPNP
jgi:ABC-type phosphate transport system substrate-binding protein